MALLLPIPVIHIASKLSSIISRNDGQLHTVVEAWFGKREIEIERVLLCKIFGDYMYSIWQIKFLKLSVFAPKITQKLHRASYHQSSFHIQEDLRYGEMIDRIQSYRQAGTKTWDLPEGKYAIIAIIIYVGSTNRWKPKADDWWYEGILFDFILSIRQNTL